MLGQVRINLDKIFWEIKENGMFEEPEGQVLFEGPENDNQVHNAGSWEGNETYK